MKLLGKPVSGGITMNNIYKLIEKKIEINNDLISNVDEEIIKFHDALNQSTIDLNILGEKISKNKALKDLEIFTSHKLIVNDPLIIKEVEKLISINNLNAASAYKIVIDKFIEKFNSMDNEYMKERSIDIIDVYKRVAGNIINKNIIHNLVMTKDVILVKDYITPSMVLSINKKLVKGIILKDGGKTSHSSLMIKNLGIPLIIGVKENFDLLQNGDFVIMDGESGIIISSPTSDEIYEYINKQNKLKKELGLLNKYLNKNTETRDGFKVELLANINNDIEVELALKNGAEGIGLLRTEYKYLDAPKFPSEDELFITYKKVLDAYPNSKVIIRTIDIGGDKIPKYLKFKNQDILRGLPLALSNVGVFKAQIKALLRANTHGNLSIMFPMVGSISNLAKALILIDDCRFELSKKITVNSDYRLGIMVEEIEVVNDIKKYASKVDFFSIGTNDLLQSMYNIDRFSIKDIDNNQCLNDEFLNTIKSIIDASKGAGITTSMCGEMACDSEALPYLIKFGINSLSVSPKSILKIRHLISGISKI